MLTCSVACLVVGASVLCKSSTKLSNSESLEPPAPHSSGGRVCLIRSKCFKSFTNPLQNGAFWSLWRLEAQEAGSARPFPNASNPLQILYKAEHSGASGASWLRRPDLPDPFQRLQILYKSFTKRSILELLAPHGSGGRICQILPTCFKCFTNPLQNGAFWSLWRIMAQEAGSARFQMP